MEYTIDRTSYRRRSNEVEKEEEKSENPFGYKILKKLMIQSMAGAFIVLTAFILKWCRVQSAVDWIHQEIQQDISIATLYENAKTKVMEFYANLQQEEENNIANGEENNIGEEGVTSSIQTDVATEPTYESAVEGVNQLSEDAKYVKENFTLIYPLQGQVTSGFGVRNSSNPIVTPYHSGIDLAADTGTKIKAALSGTVIKAETNDAYGKHIMIQKDDLILVYAHCSKLNVKVNQTVKQGDVIGEVGSTGWATGPHLHFEIRREDRLVNPADVLDFGE